MGPQEVYPRILLCSLFQDEYDEDDKPSLKETTQINEDMTGLRGASITSIGVPASANNDEDCGLMGQFSSHLQHQSKKAKNDIPTTNLENSISLPQQPGNKVVPSIRDPVIVEQMCQPKPTPGNYEHKRLLRRVTRHFNTNCRGHIYFSRAKFFITGTDLLNT